MKTAQSAKARIFYSTTAYEEKWYYGICRLVNRDMSVMLRILERSIYSFFVLKNMSRQLSDNDGMPGRIKLLFLSCHTGVSLRKSQRAFPTRSFDSQCSPCEDERCL
jgi:hypothetical protein